MPIRREYTVTVIVDTPLGSERWRQALELERQLSELAESADDISFGEVTNPQ